MATPDIQKQVEAPDNLAEQIGKEIDRARTVSGLTVSELHRRTGISRTVLQGYEAGRFKPGARELYLIARALSVSPNKLLFGRDDVREPDPLESMLGAPDRAANVAKLSIIFSVLSREEQRAMLTLVSLLAEARMGGRDKVAQVLAAADAMVSAAPEIFETVEASLTPDVQRRIAESVEKALPSRKTPSLRARKTQKPDE
jgi:transcriptional regulator with XRE-family HTH domain